MSVTLDADYSIQLQESSGSDSSEDNVVEGVAREALSHSNEPLALVRREKLQQQSWSRWGAKLAYKVGVTILTTALYPFTNHASALHTFSCLEEFLDPFCSLTKKAETSIYNLLVDDNAACKLVQSLIRHANEGNESKVQEKHQALLQFISHRDDTEDLISVVDDIKELGLLKKKMRELPSDVNHMKREEEQQRWKAMHAIEIPRLDVKALSELLRNPEVVKNKVTRHLVNLCYTKQSNLDLVQVEEALQQVTKDPASIKKAVSAFLPDKKDAPKIAEHIAAELEYAESDIEAFCARVRLLFEHLSQEEPVKCKKSNRKMTRLFRDVLQTRIYQVLKEDPNHPVIHALHRLAVAVWNDVKALQAYQQLGEKMLAAKGGFRPGDAPVTGTDVVENLTATHRVSQAELYSDLGWDIVSYGWANPSQVAQSMASHEGIWGSVANLVGHSQYDPHMQANNNPSLQGETTTRVNEQILKSRNCYGGSPTIGRDVSPEFVAVLQAVENNHYANQHDPEIPNHVFYINLQNINLDQGESPRSCSIMELNFRFPKTFLGITLPKDSQFYKTTEWGSVEAFTASLKERLLHDTAFMLTGRSAYDRAALDQGFYFPPHHEWNAIFETVLDVVEKRFNQLAAEKPEVFCGAYQEYFYSILQSYLEVYIGQKLTRRNVVNPMIMVIRACKENIDRGGVENMKYLYYHLGEEYFTGPKKSEGMSLITGVFHSRALSARKRMIHMHRTEETFNLFRLVGRKAFREDLKALGVDETQFIPVK